LLYSGEKGRWLLGGRKINIYLPTFKGGGRKRLVLYALIEKGGIGNETGNS